jgi:hypothetical protein
MTTSKDFLKKDEWEVATFDSDTSGAIVYEGGLSWEDAVEKAEEMWNSGKYYGVEVVSCDPDELDPIQWIRTKSQFLESF